MTVLSDMPFDVFLEIVVCVFLAATIAYCALIDRRLRAMRSGQDGLRELVVELNAATERAVGAISGLKEASESTNGELGQQVRSARALVDELSLMVEAGNSIADRLGRSEPAAPPRAPIQTAAGPRTAPTERDAAVAARAANQLLEALKKQAR